eukprot:m.30241 g.30241  ORF g.30241 m.30241 type:complete len:325 (-) comp16240_c0_seq1:38-1012(-)
MENSKYAGSYASPITTGTYSDMALLDEGFFSKVYKATSPNNEPCVLKLVPLDDGYPPFQCMEEAWTLKGLVHPNIVDCADFFYHQHDTKSYGCIVMEWCDAGTLADHCTRGSSFDQVADALRQLVSALIFVNRSGFIHGDVKMENVLVKQQAHTKRDLLKLADFGAVSRTTPSGHCGSSPKGTICFSAPERFLVDEKGPPPFDYMHTDVWSLACTVWEAATGDCLPLGDGPQVIGKIAAKSLTNELEKQHWAQTKISLLQVFKRTLSQSTDISNSRDVIVSTLVEMLTSMWDENANSRLRLDQMAGRCSVWEPKFFFQATGDVA